MIATLNFQDSYRFIETLTGSADTVMGFRAYPERPNAHCYPDTWSGTLAEYEQYITEKNQSGCAISCSVQALDGKGEKTENVTAIRALFVDFDGYLPIGAEWHLQPSIVTVNANGKGHAYWVLKSSGDPAQCKELLKRLVVRYADFGTDLKCTDIARVMRLPGTWHQKANPVLTRLLHCWDKKYSVEEVMEGVAKYPEKPKPAALKASSPPKKKKGKAKFADDLEYYVNLLANCTEGGRNSLLNDAAMTLFGRYHESVGLIRSALTGAAIECGLSLQEIKATLDSGESGAEKKPLNEDAEKTQSRPTIKTLNKSIAESGDIVRLNTMSGKIEVNGTPLDMDMIRWFTMGKFDYTLSTEDSIQCWVGAGYDNPYHPVVEYLRSIPESTTTVDLSTLALELLGNPAPLAAVMLKKKLIAAVARVMRPGCQDDAMFVISGAQGLGKTRFIEALASSAWFTNDLTDIHNKDHLQLLSQKWLIEMGEVDGVMSKKEDAELKAFITKSEDIYRKAYKRENVAAKRTSSIFATTNKTEILQDPTGSRRFHIVEALQKIDVQQVVQMRDSIWLSALKAYDAGEQWHLTDEEDDERKSVTDQFTESDSWTESIRWREVALEHLSCYITNYTRLYEHLGIPMTSRTKQTDRRLNSILTLHGWAYKNVKIDGKAVKHWRTSSKTW